MIAAVRSFFKMNIFTCSVLHYPIQMGGPTLQSRVS